MNHTSYTFSLPLKAIAYLLSYPEKDDTRRNAELTDLARLLRQQPALSPALYEGIDALIQAMLVTPALQWQAQYVLTFDTARQQSLHLFEHVHGDSRERGPAMIDLTNTYLQSGLYLKEGELPDYLPVVLEFASTLEDATARAFLAEFAHLLTLLHQSLVGQNNPYASLFAALLHLAGAHTSTPTPMRVTTKNQSIDEAWEEPLAFGGCPTTAVPTQRSEYPIHMVSRKSTPSSLGERP